MIVPAGDEIGTGTSGVVGVPSARGRHPPPSPNRHRGPDVRQLEILALVLDEPGLTMSALSDRLSSGRSSLTMRVAYLTRRGLVYRQGDAQDARMRRIWTSAAGERLILDALDGRSVPPDA